MLGLSQASVPWTFLTQLFTLFTAVSILLRPKRAIDERIKDK
jgi:hypothetical protein